MKYKAHIRFASILGCGVVGTETGAVNESTSMSQLTIQRKLYSAL